MTNRREFLTRTLAATAGIAAAGPSVVTGLAAPARKFKMSLNPSAIGVRIDQKGLVDLAHRHGFEAVVAMPKALAAMQEAELHEFLSDMKTKGLVWGSAGLPVDFRKDDSRFRADLKALPGCCSALRKAGVERLGTWIMPTHAELTYMANFRQHVDRLRDCARVLKDYDLRLGLEYVGPQTLMTSRRFTFIHSLAETRDLISEIDSGHVGIQLDSFHWYCAGETEEDLLSLTNQEVVLCDLNDARKGIAPRDQIDGQRELPSSTGVINLKMFLGALVQIGFDGPIRAEPFNSALNQMDNETAVRATFGAMKRAFDLVEEI